MFVALTAYPEFFKKHMQLFVAIAPVVYLTAMSAEVFVYMGKNEKFLENLEAAMGPEMFGEPAGAP